MKKSTIWLLAMVMAFAFAGLLYLQISYVRIILKTRSEQFDETVKQCLHRVSKNLELDETRQYLEDDVNRDQNSFLYQNVIITDSDGGVQQIELQSFSSPKFQPRSSLSNRPTSSIVNTSKDLQKTLKQRWNSLTRCGLFRLFRLNIPDARGHRRPRCPIRLKRR